MKAQILEACSEVADALASLAIVALDAYAAGLYGLRLLVLTAQHRLCVQHTYAVNWWGCQDCTFAWLLHKHLSQ
jgi:hypothetical protein